MNTSLIPMFDLYFDQEIKPSQLILECFENCKKQSHKNNIKVWQTWCSSLQAFSRPEINNHKIAFYQLDLFCKDSIENHANDPLIGYLQKVITMEKNPDFYYNGTLHNDLIYLYLKLNESE